MVIKKALMRKIINCIESAADNYKNRTTESNVNALEDIESDLEGALKAVKKLIAMNYTERNHAWERGE